MTAPIFALALFILSGCVLVVHPPAENPRRPAANREYQEKLESQRLKDHSKMREEADGYAF